MLLNQSSYSLLTGNLLDVTGFTPTTGIFYVVYLGYDICIPVPDTYYVLTSRGYVQAQLIVEGDCLIAKKTTGTSSTEVQVDVLYKVQRVYCPPIGSGIKSTLDSSLSASIKSTSTSLPCVCCTLRDTEGVTLYSPLYYGVTA